MILKFNFKTNKYNHSPPIRGATFLFTVKLILYLLRDRGKLLPDRLVQKWVTKKLLNV